MVGWNLRRRRTARQVFTPPRPVHSRPPIHSRPAFASPRHFPPRAFPARATRRSPPTPPSPDEAVALRDVVDGALQGLDDRIKRSAYDTRHMASTANVPRSMICPITRMPMADPVILTDGYSYERSAIAEWLKRSKTSPCTGAKLAFTLLLPNHNLRNAIAELMAQK